MVQKLLVIASEHTGMAPAVVEPRQTKAASVRPAEGPELVGVQLAAAASVHQRPETESAVALWASSEHQTRDVGKRVACLALVALTSEHPSLVAETEGVALIGGAASAYQKEVEVVRSDKVAPPLCRSMVPVTAVVGEAGFVHPGSVAAWVELTLPVALVCPCLRASPVAALKQWTMWFSRRRWAVAREEVVAIFLLLVFAATLHKTPLHHCRAHLPLQPKPMPRPRHRHHCRAVPHSELQQQRQQQELHPPSLAVHEIHRRGMP